MFHVPLLVQFSILTPLTLSRIFPVYIYRSYVPFWGCSCLIMCLFALLHSCLLARLLTYPKFMLVSRIVGNIFSLYVLFLLFLPHSYTDHPPSVLSLFPLSCLPVFILFVSLSNCLTVSLSNCCRCLTVSLLFFVLSHYLM